MTTADQAERLRQLAKTNLHPETVNSTDTPNESPSEPAEQPPEKVDSLSSTQSQGKSAGASDTAPSVRSAEIDRSAAAKNGRNSRVRWLGDEQTVGSSEKAQTSTPISKHSKQRAPVHRARFIAVTSGKGGVGKSNIAVNLAIALAQSGLRISLIDADMGTANADVLCGIRPAHNLSHFLTGRRSRIEDVFVDGPGGFQLVPGANGIRHLAELDEEQRTRLIQGLSGLEKTSDIVLLDTSAGINAVVTAMSHVADTVLLVLTPEPTSIADGYALIKAIHAQALRAGSTHEMQRIAILVNMASSKQQGRAVYDRISSVSRRFLNRHLDYAGWIPQDSAVPRAVIRREPFFIAAPRCGASRAIAQLGCALSSSQPGVVYVGGENSSPQHSGYFARLYHWLRQQA